MQKNNKNTSNFYFSINNKLSYKKLSDFSINHKICIILIIESTNIFFTSNIKLQY